MVVLSLEIIGLAASVVGVLGLILRKARCFIRRVSGSWDCGEGFCDSTILPAKSSPPQVNTCDHHQSSNDTGPLARTSASTYSVVPRSWELFKRA